MEKKQLEISKLKQEGLERMKTSPMSAHQVKQKREMRARARARARHATARAKAKGRPRPRPRARARGRGRASVRQLKSKKPRFYLGSRGPNAERAKETATGKDSSKVKTRASGLGHWETTSLMMSSTFLMGNTTGAMALSLWLPASTTCFCVSKSFWRQWRWKLRLPPMLLFSVPSLMRLCRKCLKIKTSYFNPWAGVRTWWEPI